MVASALRRVALSELRLTRWQRLRLQRQLKRARDARVYRRTLAILECGRGEPIAPIARTLGVTRQSVHNWITAYADAHDPESLVHDHRAGRPSPRTDQVPPGFQAPFADT